MPGPTGPTGPTGTALNWQGTWSISTTYAINDAVMFNGTSYRGLTASNVGNQPDGSPTNWAVVAQAANVGGSLTSGGGLSNSTTSNLFTFTNTNTTAGNRVTLLGVIGAPSPLITYSAPPSGSGLPNTYAAAMATTTTGTNVGNYGDTNNQAAIPIWGNNRSSGASNWGLGVLGTTTSPNGRAVMGQATVAPSAAGKLVTGVYGETTAAQTVGTSAGVVGTATGASGTTFGTLGTIPAAGSSAGVGVRGENLNTTGGVGVQAYTAAAGGRSMVAIGSVFIENRSAQGSATSGTDGLIVWSNSGASGFNSSGALFTPSDRNSKKDFTPISAREVLDKLVALDVTRWHYKNDDNTWYMGPMAQDFFAAFGLGDKDTVIHGVNADGVALAAIKGLNEKLETEVSTLKKSLASREESLSRLGTELDARGKTLASMEARVADLEALVRSRPVTGGTSIWYGAGLGAAVVLPILGLARLRRRNGMANRS